MASTIAAIAGVKDAGSPTSVCLPRRKPIAHLAKASNKQWNVWLIA
jgi:hypothetical protein